MSLRGGMDDDRFVRLLEAYGARMESWPADIRDAAQAWLGRSSTAREELERAAHLDKWLGAAIDAEPSAGLRARVATIPILHPAGTSEGWWPFRSLWAPLLAWTGAVALGVAVGSAERLLPDPALDAEPFADMVVDSDDEQAAAVDDDFSELSDLAFGAGLALEEEW